MAQSLLIVPLYAKALQALATSIDERLESLRWTLSAVDPQRRTPECPDVLETMVMTPQGTRETAYTALFREGFIYLDIDRIAFRTFSADEMATQQAALSAYETLAVIRSRIVKLNRAKRALTARNEEFSLAAKNASKIGMVFGFQRLMLTMVAAIASERHMKAYLASLRVADCYAWATHLEEQDLPAFATKVQALYECYLSRDVVPAARLATEIRAGHYG